MRKQELIHMHSLLAAVAEESEDDLDLDLEAYRSLGTRPTSINQSKTAHEDAVFALSNSICESLGNEEAAVQPKLQSASQAS